MTPPRIDVFAAFADGWALYRSHLRELLLTSLLAFVAIALSAGILFGIALAWLMLVVRRLSSNRLEVPGQTAARAVRLGPLIVGVGWLAVSLISWRIAAIPVAGSLLAGLVVLGLSPAVFWVMAFVAFRGDDVWGACRSLFARIVREGFWLPYALSFPAVLVACVGAVLGGIGAVVTMPLGCCLFQKLYEQALANEPEVEVVWR